MNQNKSGGTYTQNATNVKVEVNFNLPSELKKAFVYPPKVEYSKKEISQLKRERVEFQKRLKTKKPSVLK